MRGCVCADLKRWMRKEIDGVREEVEEGVASSSQSVLLRNLVSRISILSSLSVCLSLRFSLAFLLHSTFLMIAAEVAMSAIDQMRGLAEEIVWCASR